MKQLLSFYLVALSFCGHSAHAIDVKEFEKYFKLLPQPQKIELLSGTGISITSLRSIYLQGTSKPVLYGFLKSLPLSAKAGRGILVLKISAKKDLPESPEGYILEVKDGQVIIQSRSEAGLFYGCQTLLQLLEDARDQHINIPSCSITDYPGIAYRAVHVDLKHHLDAGYFYYDMIDRLAR